MKNNIVSVFLYGHEICRLEWKGGYRQGFGKVGSQITFSAEYAPCRFDVDPVGPYSKSSYLVQRGLSDILRAKEEEGLPRFLGGSLPDDWGNRVFSLWIEKNGIRSHDVTPVDKLAFIGKRGMGALEFIPQLYHPDSDENLILEELYGLAKEIEESRTDVAFHIQDKPGINDLMAVGMSAGGKHPKAVVSIDWETGEIRSGQVPLPESFVYYLLKFRSSEPLLAPEIEYVYYLMAKDCGIDMQDSRLLSAGGVNHFLTARFDRENGKKVHVASLHALAGEVSSYEDIFRICRRLHLPYEDMVQLYKRAVFNFLAGVCDDHDKNFSFIMDTDGIWRLSPAYDETFTVDVYNRLKYDRHAMTIEESGHQVHRQQFLRLAAENDIKGADAIINEIAETIVSFKNRANDAGVEAACSRYISDYINEQLELLG